MQWPGLPWDPRQMLGRGDPYPGIDGCQIAWAVLNGVLAHAVPQGINELRSQLHI